MDLIGLVAVLGAFGIPLYFIKTRHEARKLELEAMTGRKQLAAGQADDVKLIVEENRLLRERVENLESIVCSVDFELNKKLAKVIDEHRSLVLSPGSPGPMQADAKPDAKKPEALDRTATAHGAKPPPGR